MLITLEVGQSDGLEFIEGERGKGQVCDRDSLRLEGLNVREGPDKTLLERSSHKRL